METVVRPIRLFVSYAHTEAVWNKRLGPVLKVTSRVDGLSPWHDEEIFPGSRWDSEIRNELEKMHIFLCLVSYDFLASDYIWNVELPRAKERYENGEIEIVPILLYPMDLQHDCAFLHQFNPLPTWGKCWREYEQSGDWKDANYPIGQGLKKVIKEVRSRAM